MKKKKYQLLTDENDRYFFLEIKNNQYFYVDIEEFVELCNIFCKYPTAMNISFDNKNTIKMMPKVMVKGVATALTLATLMGCASTKVSANNFLNDTSNSALNSSYSTVDRVQRDVSFIVEDETAR